MTTKSEMIEYYKKKDFKMILHVLLKENDNVIKTVIDNNYFIINQVRFIKHISRNFTEENKKVITIFFSNKSPEDKYEIIGSIILVANICINEKRSCFKNFCNFCLYYLKDDERLTSYVFAILPVVSIDILKEIDFKLQIVEIWTFFDKKINIMDLILYLSNDDNFPDFAKLNKDYLIGISNDECKQYIESFL